MNADNHDHYQRHRMQELLAAGAMAELRLLKNERNLRAADPPHLGLGHREQIAVAKQNRPCGDASGWTHEPEDRPPGRVGDRPQGLVDGCFRHVLLRSVRPWASV